MNLIINNWKRAAAFILIGGAFALSGAGCSSILNPYKDKFACPDYDRGQCVHVEEAHRQSLKGNNKKEAAAACERCKAEAKKRGVSEKSLCTSCSAGNGEAPVYSPLAGNAGSTEYLYQAEVNRKMAGLLQTPNAPILAPAKIMRVLMLPYRGEGNELYMMRYVYFIADEPKWVVGEYLMDKED